MPKPKYNHPFIKFVRHECKRYGVKFILQRTAEASGESQCCGYFIDEPPTLEVATRILYTDFLSTLVHEYSHMMQWIDESPYFHKNYRGLDAWDITDRWIDGEDFKRKTVIKCIDTVRDCELDCERRAIETIKTHRLPIRIDKYCQKASAYMYFHNFMKISRQWDYKNYWDKMEYIAYKMPTDLSGDYSRTPRKVMRLFKKHLR